jgi:hypothetical protein
VDAPDVACISLEGVATLKPAHNFHEEVKAVKRTPAVCVGLAMLPLLLLLHDDLFIVL